MFIAVLGSATSWYVRDLQRAAADAHEIVPISFSGLASSVDAQRVGFVSGEFDLQTADAVLVRSMPPGTLEQIIFRMDVLGRLEAAGLHVYNPPRGLEAAIDKYLATAKLRAEGLDVPQTHCCQTADAAMAAWQAMGGDVVVKPLFGGEGRGITRLSDEALALRAFKMLEQFGAVIYQQQFIPHNGFDLRLLVIGRQVLAARRRNPNDWRTNVSRGAIMEPVEMTEELADIALRAAHAMQTPLAGVDLLPGADGRIYALEVNAVPGWRALSRALNLDIARRVLDFIESAAS